MPTPLEILFDPLSLVILVMYGGVILWESIAPGRKLPIVKYWKLRGLTSFAIYFYLTSYLPLFIDPVLQPFQLIDLSDMGTFIGGVIGILSYEFGVFLWHWSMHKSDFLWRTFHQMHHSAERMDSFGTFYFSPLDMIGWSLLGSVCFSLFLGLSPQAITVMLLSTTFFGMFQHANIKTPRWLGYIIQRPESHTLHHAKGIHEHNYSDLPIFDLLFGTFSNPKGFEYETGFYQGASARVGDMLLFKDVSTPKVNENSQSQSKPILS